MKIMKDHLMNNPSLNLNSKQIQLITWTLLLLMPIVGMAVDLIAPSLPAISNYLNSPPSIVKNTISLYLIGYGLGNFISGILTDSFGRRKLLLGGLLGFVVTSMIAANIPNIEILLLTRFSQGLMLGTVLVTSRAILSDILSSERLLALGIMIGVMWGIGPVIGPIIGGYLQLGFGWQAGFYFFSIIGTLGLVACFLIVPETCRNYQPLRLNVLKQNFGELLTHRQFIALAILMGLNYALIIVFNAACPFLIQNKFHYSAVEFGDIALSLGGIYLISTLVCRYSATKFNVNKLLFVGINVFLILAFSAVIASHFLSHSIAFTVAVSSIMFFACGFIYPLSMGQGMSLFRHISGNATAIMYLIMTAITSISGGLVSLVNMQNATPLMWTYLFLTFISAIVYWKLIHSAKPV